MRLRPTAWVLALACLAGAAAADPARAQDEPPPPETTFVDEFADSLASAFAPRWAGPRVEWPAPHARPASHGRLRSTLRPVNVHVGERATVAGAEDALRALEEAHAFLEREGWPLPPPDGGAGGTAGFDLYLAPVAPEDSEADSAEDRDPVQVGYDAPLGWGGLDAATSFVVVDPDATERTIVRPCVISAYVRATLLAADPAEARAWRRATGDYVAWLLTGRFGCSDRGVVRHQRESYRTWVGDAPDSGPGGALFLAMLSARTDGLTGRFIRDLWSGAPQLTWEGDQLRSAPDLWQVINVVMELGDDPLERLLEEFAVARYFVGGERSAGAPLSLTRGLPDEAVVPVVGRTRFEELPRRFEPDELELEPWGSAYLEVDTRQAAAGSRLRIWLRGEMGVGWSLIAVRLGANGEERGRVRAPVRPLNPRSYIPLELTDDQTAKVVVVVTNMGGRLADADDPDDHVRAFRLILDDGEDDE